MLVKHGEEYYICKERRVFKVNEVGARVFELCNGKITIEQIAEKISTKFTIDYGKAYDDVSSYINVLLELDIVKKV